MAPSEFTRIVLNERPLENILPNTFRKELVSLQSLGEPEGAQVLVKATWLSLDPAMRGFLKDARSYLPPVKIGEIMRGNALAIVVKAGSGSKLKIGDVVLGGFGWTEYAIADDKICEKIIVPKGAQPLDFLNTLGLPGLTAYFGLKDIGHLKAGETLVVSGAAGAVGSLACQLGKRAGAKVIAIAGSQSKCDWLEKEVGVDKAINYRVEDWRNQLKEGLNSLTRNGGYLDVYYDNVGGDMLDFMLTRLNKNARIILCGAISEYNAPKPRGLQGYLNLISQRARMQGFVIFDYTPQFPAALAELANWLADGSVKRKFHIVEGLENAPSALPLLFSGGNEGKLVVKVSDEDDVLSKL